MNVTYHDDVEQRSEAWKQIRLGRLTGSRAGDAFAQTAAQAKAGTWGAGRRNLIVQLMLERLTKRSHERQFQSQAMLDGIEREADAIARYEEITGRLVYPVGFIAHNEIPAGCSPDGLISDDGIVSVKCPLPTTHLDYLRTSAVPKDYMLQILQELWLTGRQWCDYLSFQPDFSDLGLDWKLVRVERDEAVIRDYERKALAFLQEVQVEVDAVRTMANLRGVLEAATA